MLDTKVRGTVLLNNPLIIYVGNYAASGEESSFYVLSHALKDREVIFLMLLAWTAEFDSPSLKIIEWREKYLKKFPKNRLVFLTNTLGEKNTLSNLGVEAEFANHNIFVDENLFFPIPSQIKEFDAVYNGQFLAFKRHYLAEKIKSLALIGYNFDTPYGQEMLNQMSHANFCNKDDRGVLKWLNQKDVNNIYNKSRVALCLSKAEGAMHASMEYLLSGLPIVTTFSKGGRDYFFQGDYVFWIEDTPAAIADAVDYVKKLKIDPEYIRSQTLEKLKKERLAFFNYLKKLSGDSEDCTDQIQEIWKKNYNDKLIVPKTIPILLTDIT